MEQAKALQTVKPQELQRYSASSKTLAPDEKEIVKVKYHSPRFGAMEEGDIFSTGSKLLLKIHVITGWKIHEEPEFRHVLTEQFIKKLSEGYGNMNADEIEYAFRNNTTVKDWGKSMNLALIDEVLRPYLEKRAQVSQMEEAAKRPAELPAPEINMTDEELTRAAFETFRKIQKHELIPLKVYDYLTAEGKLNLSLADKRAIRESVERVLKTNYRSDETFAAEFDRINNKEEYIRNESRKFSVARYFNTLILKKESL